MTEKSHLPQSLVHALRLAGLILALCGALSACTTDNETDYCKNHYRFHDEHQDTVATLHLELTDQGMLTGELTLPLAILESKADNSTRATTTPAQLEARVSDAANVFIMQSEVACLASTARIERTEAEVTAHYQSECGTGNKIGQIDIPLFDHLPELDEVVVNIATHATAKRFAISRQCSSAIFRLDGHQGF